MATEKTFEEIHIGDTADFTRTVTEVDVQGFAILSGDQNPLHGDRAYASTTDFKKPIVHGMLLASFFSELIGMRLPGKHALYLSQSLIFRKPVFVGDEVRVYGRVVSKSESTNSIEIETQILAHGECAVDGVARVRVL